MSSSSICYYTTQCVMAIDPCLLEWECTAWGYIWGNCQCSFSSFSSRINVPTLIFVFSRSQCSRMTVMSIVSLKIGLRLLGVGLGVSYSISYWLIYILSILIVQYFVYRYVFDNFKISELSNLVDSLPAALDYNLTVFNQSLDTSSVMSKMLCCYKH